MKSKKINKSKEVDSRLGTRVKKDKDLLQKQLEKAIKEKVAELKEQDLDTTKITREEVQAAQAAQSPVYAKEKPVLPKKSPIRSKRFAKAK